MGSLRSTTAAPLVIREKTRVNRFLSVHSYFQTNQNTFIRTKDIQTVVYRFSVALTNETAEILDKYEKNLDVSKATIIRDALKLYERQHTMKAKVSPDLIDAYVDYLANMEHVIVDIAHWKAIFQEIGEGSEEFWKQLFAIGAAHTKEYADKGIVNTESVLRHVEKTNWYKLNVDSDKRFTLILTVSEASRFVKTFFEGFFSNFPRDVEIIEEYKKIRIRIN